MTRAHLMNPDGREAGFAVGLQGARSAMWWFHLSDEQRRSTRVESLPVWVSAHSTEVVRPKRGS